MKPGNYISVLSLSHFNRFQYNSHVLLACSLNALYSLYFAEIYSGKYVAPHQKKNTVKCVDSFLEALQVETFVSSSVSIKL